MDFFRVGKNVELEQGLTITTPQEYVRKVNVRAGSNFCY